jgi:hypothetical protein
MQQQDQRPGLCIGPIQVDEVAIRRIQSLALPNNRRPLPKQSRPKRLQVGITQPPRGNEAVGMNDRHNCNREIVP